MERIKVFDLRLMAGDFRRNPDADTYETDIS